VKRIALLMAATAAVIAVLVTVRMKDEPARRPPAAVSPRLPSSTSSRAAPALSAPTDSTSSSSTPAGHHATYRSGTAVGAAHTDYGDVRLRVTVAHRRIVGIVALQLPDGNPMDLQLSRPAVRTLTREVLQKQSLDVDVVTGATYTSDGYLRSLQSALDRLS
jgi:uncharacterized protein with FMN-binding domain